MSTYALRVLRKERETADCASIWFDVPSDLRQTFAHRPGQFISIAIEIAGEPTIRQYSISSLAGDPRGLRITIKKVPKGKVSTWLVDWVEPGDVIDVGAPRGVFFKPLDGSHRVVLLACGSGIAPILPIARQLLTDAAGHHVSLIYGSRSVNEIILRKEVDQLSEFTSAQVEHVLSRADATWQGNRGRLDTGFLAARDGTWHPSAGHLPMIVYLCGPEEFMDGAEAHFKTLGLEDSAIRRESFDLVLGEDDEDEASLVVSGTETAGELSETCEEIVAVVGGEETRVVPEPGETILGALIRVEAPVPFSCQEGTCSSCISKIKGGTAHVRPGVLKSLRQDDLDEGLILSCLARPASKAIRIDFDDI